MQLQYAVTPTVKVTHIVKLSFYWSVKVTMAFVVILTHVAIHVIKYTNGR